MARAEWTLTAEDEPTEIACWIAVEDERPLTARRIVQEIQHKAETCLGDFPFWTAWLKFQLDRL